MLPAFPTPLVLWFRCALICRIWASVVVGAALNTMPGMPPLSQRCASACSAAASMSVSAMTENNHDMPPAGWTGEPCCRRYTTSSAGIRMGSERFRP